LKKRQVGAGQLFHTGRERGGGRNRGEFRGDRKQRKSQDRQRKIDGENVGPAMLLKDYQPGESGKRNEFTSCKDNERAEEGLDDWIQIGGGTGLKFDVKNKTTGIL